MRTINKKEWLQVLTLCNLNCYFIVSTKNRTYVEFGPIREAYSMYNNIFRLSDKDISNIRLKYRASIPFKSLVEANYKAKKQYNNIRHLMKEQKNLFRMLIMIAARKKISVYSDKKCYKYTQLFWPAYDKEKYHCTLYRRPYKEYVFCRNIKKEIFFYAERFIISDDCKVRDHSPGIKIKMSHIRKAYNQFKAILLSFPHYNL